MSLQLLVLAIVAMSALAVLRVVRVKMGRTPHPDEWARIPFIAAFLVLPPILLSAVVQAQTGSSLMRGVSWVLPYIVIVGGLAILMGVIAPLVGRFAPPSVRSSLVLALSASEGDPDRVPYDPPVTAEIAASVAGVDRANAVFPRGTEFPGQVEREGFRYAWDTLEAATTTLEGRIADDRRRGLPVAAAARSVAADARSRLDTLHQLALDRGQIWAT